MSGMNRQTGKLLSGWDHVVQSVRVIFTTPFFERVMRGYVGSHVIRLLGENVSAQTLLRIRWGIALAIDLFEPRLTPYRIDITEFDRTGASTWVIEVIYRPNALSGDMTPSGIRTLAFDPDELKQAIVAAYPEAA
ncbi:GPW/gp25 family protein [Bradyrhizobium valentinum]|uniref:IraD/Gp25-like domain-containing protein n=1 Tax=Bradyrhizobium valentinum TaxID=1518501 RepID=A0A0R3KWV8_9BRAD|nr:GPW/gp25 family protein [Bradyrhizobium valentinum]KRQ99277.1 hypothetical protein CP49_11820 [Bradyrhizobium valentinum]